MATVTYLGSIGTQGSGVTSLSLPAHNQAAGNLIVVTMQTYENSAQTVTGVADTAGNSYTQVLA